MVNAHESRSRTGLELRSDTTGGGYTLTGYASVFNAPYEVNDFLGSYSETIRSGAFTKSLQERDDVRLLLNHEGVPLARTKSGTLTLSQDSTGLRCEARLDPNSPMVASVKSAMDRGDLDQMSFAFRATKQSWNEDYTVRDINEAQLFDVSVVTYPASPETSVALRSLVTVDAQVRAAAILDRAAREYRAGTLDPGTRDLLLQILGSIDGATEQIECASESLEMVLGVVEPDSDMDDMGEMDDVPVPIVTASTVPRSASALLMLRAAALDL